MITDKDAKGLVAELRMLSAKHVVTVSDVYTQGQHDGRRDAYRMAADWVEQSNHEETKQ